MRKLLSLLLCLAMVLSLAAPVIATESQDIVVFYTNDIHTYIDNHIGEGNENGLTYSKVAALKKSRENVLLVDAGDHVQGTAYGGLDKGETIVKLMNASGYDLATLGNHEFDYGMNGCKQVIDWAEYPYISSNFYHEHDGVAGENVLDSYKIFEVAGKKIAFVGITTPETITSSAPAYFQDENGNYIYGIAGGRDGEDLYTAVQGAIDAAEAAGADYVIALGHLGIDPSSAPWRSTDVIENTTGLDAFIDGHSHSTVESQEVTDEAGKTVLLTQTGSYLDAVGKLTISSEGITTELISGEDLAELTPDPAVKAIEDAWISEVDGLLGQVIGHTEVTFDNYDSNGNRLVRKQSTNTGDFAADALYYLFDNMDMDVDVAVMNGGGVRNNAITGDLSYLTCKEIHTFGNVACLLTVTGRQLLDALEWGSYGLRADGTAENGSFLHVSGCRFTLDLTYDSTAQCDEKQVWTGSPTGEYRVKDVEIFNTETGEYEPLDLEAKYNLAGYNYTLRDLGGGFDMFKGAVNVLDYVMEDYMVLANYIQSFPVNEETGLPTITEDAGYSDVNGSGRINIITEVEETGLWVDGVNACETASGEGWSYDKASGTLTLSGAKIDTSYPYVQDDPYTFYAGIYAEGDLNIVLAEGTENTVAPAEKDGAVSLGITVDGDLTISGKGSLQVSSNDATIESYAIEVSDTLTIDGSCVTATAGKAGQDSYSVGADVGAITINGGTLQAEGGEGGVSMGIYSYGPMLLKQGTVYGKAADADGSAGMYAEGKVTMTDSTLELTAGKGDYSSEGLMVMDELTATNSYVTVQSGVVSGEDGTSYGISSGKTVFTDSDVKVTSGGQGIVADELTFTDGTLTIDAEDDGIYCWFGSVTIDCTEVGISTRGTPGLTGTKVTINAGNYGIYAANGLEVSELLTVSTPENGTIKTLQDAEGMTFHTVADKDDKAATNIVMEPLGYTVSIRGLSYNMGVKVPAGMSLNEAYCKIYRVDDFSQILKTEKDGYTFIGWYTDEACSAGKEYSFDSPVTADVTIYPKWEKVVCDGGENCPSGDFSDIDTDAWYHEAVDYVITKGLMNGVGDGKFDPSGDASRAMVVTILWRMAGEPEVDDTMTFKDVEDDAWYTMAVRWAARNEIVKGYSPETFAPDDEITREQLVTVLYRYAEYVGCDVAFSDEALDFPDAGEVNSWAADGMKWACNKSLIIGRDDGTLDPQGIATRAEAAQILMRFLKQ